MSLSSESNNDYDLLSKLLLSGLKGCHESYGEFLEKLRKNIDRYLTIRSMAADQKEDIIQDVLLSIHLARHTYDPKQPFGPWLVAIIRRRMIDKYRSEKRFIAEDITNNLNVSLRDQSLDNNILLEQLLAELKPLQRSALIETEVFGHSTAEVAQKLNMSHGAMRVMLHRTLKTLKSMVEV